MVGSKNWGTFSTMIVCVVFLLCCDLILAKSRAPITDAEIRQKKNDCYADIESDAHSYGDNVKMFSVRSGMWGQHCLSSTVAKENCALRCLSPICYELIYEGDPLEEGEKDYTRSSEYKYCMHRVSLGESLDGIRGTLDN